MGSSILYVGRSHDGLSSDDHVVGISAGLGSNDRSESGVLVAQNAVFDRCLSGLRVPEAFGTVTACTYISQYKAKVLLDPRYEPFSYRFSLSAHVQKIPVTVSSPWMDTGNLW